jgi:DNA-binding transcriptional LysR family regulator
MPERMIELGSYPALLGCVIAGLGVALLPRSVLSTFPDSKRLSVHALPRGENRAETVLIWRNGAGSPNIQALQQLLHDNNQVGRTKAKREI